MAGWAKSAGGAKSAGTELNVNNRKSKYMLISVLGREKTIIYAFKAVYKLKYLGNMVGSEGYINLHNTNINTT